MTIPNHNKNLNPVYPIYPVILSKIFSESSVTSVAILLFSNLKFQISNRNSSKILNPVNPINPVNLVKILTVIIIANPRQKPKRSRREKQAHACRITQCQRPAEAAKAAKEHLKKTSECLQNMVKTCRNHTTF